MIKQERVKMQKKKRVYHEKYQKSMKQGLEVTGEDKREGMSEESS